MVRVHVLLVVLLLVHLVPAGGSPTQRGELPFSVRGGAWTLEDSVRTYEGEALFSLIDGGAPLYFEYGFTVVRSGRYRGTNGGTVAAEVYEMSAAGGAFGLYSYLAAGSGIPAKVGWIGTEGTGFALAWKGRQVWAFTALDSAGSDSLLVLSRELTGPPSLSWELPAETKWFATTFPEARDAVLFFGPLGCQKRTLSLPERVLGIRQGMSGILPEGEVVMFEYSSRDELGMRRDSLLRFVGAEGAAGGRGWQVLTWHGDEFLIATAGEKLLVIVRGRDRGQLVELWRRVQWSESRRGR